MAQVSNVYSKFKDALPCEDCDLSKVCKYKETVKPVEIPDFFSITLGCTHKNSILKGDTNEQ